LPSLPSIRWTIFYHKSYFSFKRELRSFSKAREKDWGKHALVSEYKNSEGTNGIAFPLLFSIFSVICTAFTISSLNDIQHVYGTFGCQRLLMIGSWKFFSGWLTFCGIVWCCTLLWYIWLKINQRIFEDKSSSFEFFL